jgi:peroxiredoxin
MAQTQFTVKGTAHKDAKTLALMEIGKNQQPEMINVTNGTFTINTDKPEGTVMAIMDPQNNLFNMFVVDGKEMTLDMNTDEVKGSAQNMALAKLALAMSKAKTETEQEEVLRQGLAANPNNAVGAFAMSQLMYVMSYDELKAEIEKDAPYLKHPLCAKVKPYLESLALRAPGTMFKDIEEADTLGNSHKLSEYVGKGNYVLIDFWASWCGPCMMEMPNVKANFEKYKAKGFNVVGLSFDRNADAWKKAIVEKELNWTHLSDLKFWQTIAAQTYGIRSIPSSILCDPTGKIIALDLRGEKLGNKLKEIYGF